MPGIQWLDTTVDTLVSRDPGYFHGCVIEAEALGGLVTFYNGTDATSGQEILRVKGPKDISLPILFPTPLYCARGLFVGGFDHLDHCLVLWEPVAE